METPGRGSGVRRYGMEDVRRLRFIRQAQAAGFSLDEIAVLIALDAGRDRARARELARDKIGALDAKIAELTGARTALQRHASAFSASDDCPCPNIVACYCSYEIGRSSCRERGCAVVWIEVVDGSLKQKK